MSYSMDMVNRLFHQSVIFDVETTSLTRQGGIHQMSWIDLGSGHVTELNLAPNLLMSQTATQQDAAKLVSDALDIHQYHPISGNTDQWKDIIRAQLLMEEQPRKRLAADLKKIGMAVPDLKDIKGIKAMPWDIIRKELEYHPFLKGTIEDPAFWYFNEGKQLSDKEALRQIQAAGGKASKFTSYNNVAMAQVLHGEGEVSLKRNLREKVIMIANANYESKIVGAHHAAGEDLIREKAITEGWSRQKLQKELEKSSNLRSILNESSLTVADTFQLSGKNYLESRAIAQVTGDWSNVFRNIVQHAKPGDSIDILDFFRSQQSMAQKLGVLPGTKPFALSVDIQTRLYGYSTAPDKATAVARLKEAETHIARMDVAVSEQKAVKWAAEQAYAADQVLLGTDEGKKLLRLAREEGRGAYHDFIKHAHIQSHYATPLQTSLLGERIARGLEDLATEAVSTQTESTSQITRKVFVKGGGVERRQGVRHGKVDITEAGKLVDFLVGHPDYSQADNTKVWNDIRDLLTKEKIIATQGDNIEILNPQKLQSRAKDLYEGYRASQADIFRDITEDTIRGFEQGGFKYPSRARPASPLPSISGRSLGRIGMAAAAFAGLGVLSGGMSNRQQRQGPESLRTMNYERWLSLQGGMYGMNTQHMSAGGDMGYILEGLSKTGLGNEFRSQMTDFGSPYMGPQMSQSVFSQMALLQEREKYTTNSFAATHYDPAGAIGMLLDRWTASGQIHPIAFAQQVIQHNRQSGINHGFITSGDGRWVNGAQYAGLRGKNLLSIDLASGKWAMNFTDADTLTVKRAGVVGAIQSFFGQNKGYSFRLAGLDAPETKHGTGYREAQPYANQATQVANAMLSGAKSVELLIDIDQVTYGRQLATLMGDGRNINLELVRQGAAAHLPFRKKGLKEMYDQNAYSAAQGMARSAEKGMWAFPFFKAYADINKSSGQTITFNTLTQVSKMAENSSLMSIGALMHNAQQQGFYDTAMAMEAADIGSRMRQISNRDKSPFAKDYRSAQWKETHMFKSRSAPHKSYMSQMLGETAGLIKTRGGHYTQKYKTSRMNQLDKRLALDSTTSTSIWSKRKLFANRMYGGYDRALETKERMAEMQQVLNHHMFNSPIGHHRM